MIQVRVPPPCHTVQINGSSAYISCDTAVYRRLMNHTAVKKALSIPSWLNDAAIAAGLDLSQILQDALKAYLHIS